MNADKSIKPLNPNARFIGAEANKIGLEVVFRNGSAPRFQLGITDADGAPVPLAELSMSGVEYLQRCLTQLLRVMRGDPAGFVARRERE